MEIAGLATRFLCYYPAVPNRDAGAGYFYYGL